MLEKKMSSFEESMGMVLLSDKLRNRQETPKQRIQKANIVAREMEVGKLKGRYAKLFRDAVAGCTCVTCELRQQFCSHISAVQALETDRIWEGCREVTVSNKPMDMDLLMALSARRAGVKEFNFAANRGQCFNFGGVMGCLGGYLAFHGFSTARAEKFRQWACSSDSERRRTLRAMATHPPGVMARHVQEFIGEHYEFLAEWDPTGGVVRIPRDVKLTVYHQFYALYCANLKIPMVHYSYFCFVWRKSFQHVKMTNKSKFAQCATCQRLNHVISKCPGRENEEKKHVAFACKCAHVEYVRNCRRMITFMELVSRYFPTKMLFFYGDRMDAQKTTIPKPAREMKNVSGTGRVKMSIMNVYSSLMNMFVVSDNNVRHTASSRVWIDLQTLLASKAVLGSIPQEKVVIVEDSAGENRNRLRLFVWGILVARGIVESVEFLFLPVGHTHGSCDRIFSSISRRMSSIQEGVNSPKELEEAVCSAWTGPVPTCLWWMLKNPEMERWFQGNTAVLTEMKKVPVRPDGGLARIVISRGQSQHGVQFETFATLLQDSEIERTYSSSLEGSSVHGKCGSFLSYLINRGKIKPQFLEDKDIASFVSWWKEHIMIPKAAGRVELNLTSLQEQVGMQTFWSAAFTSPVDIKGVAEAVVKAGFEMDESWNQFLQLVQGREEFFNGTCGECAHFLRLEKDARRPGSIADTEEGRELRRISQNMRKDNRRRWIKHREQEVHRQMGRVGWSMESFLLLLEGFNMEQWRRDEHDMFCRLRVPEQMERKEWEDRTREWEQLRRFGDIPASVKKTLNEQCSMFRNSGYLNARFDTLARTWEIQSHHVRFDESVLSDTSRWAQGAFRFLGAERKDPEIDQRTGAEFFAYLKRINMEDVHMRESWDQSLADTSSPIEVFDELIMGAQVINWTDTDLHGKFLLVLKNEPCPNKRGRVFEIVRFLGCSDESGRIFVEYWDLVNNGELRARVWTASVADSHQNVDWYNDQCEDWPPWDGSEYMRENVQRTEYVCFWEEEPDRWRGMIAEPWNVMRATREAGSLNQFGLQPPVFRFPAHLAGALRAEWSAELCATLLSDLLS